MVWTLLAIKGNKTDYPYFQNNTLLAAYLQKEGITFVSALDPLNPEDLSLRTPIHQFLNGFYPFYRNDRRYIHHENKIVDGIIANIRNPEYLKFFFKELGVFGEDGPYAIVFEGLKVSVKFLGHGGWTAYGIGNYIKGPELYPPTIWEEHPDDFTPPIPIPPAFAKKRIILPPSDEKSGSNFNKLDGKNSSSEPSGAKPNLKPEISENKKIDSPPKFVSASIPIKNPDWLKQIEEEKQRLLKENEPEIDFHEVYGEIPPEALRLIQTIREQQLELGFQQLMQIIQFKQLHSKTEDLISPVNEIIKMNIDAHYTIVMDDPIGHLKMEPLHRALYVLFLQHPNGINLYELKKYKEPLLHIYKAITQREEMQPIIDSIDRLVNRHDNSIYEKISRINNTIRGRLIYFSIPPSPYLIIGKRGEVKRVLGSRDWVNWG